MPLTTVAELVATLRSIHLLAPAQSAQLAALQGKIADVQSFAKHLIGQGWVTPLQINQVLQGKGQELLVGAYVLVERLGAGGMGEVYKAKNWKMGRLVALKIIRKDRLGSATAVNRFYREVRAASQLAHPNIVTAFDAGQAGPTHYFAMEYVEGIDLARLVKESGPATVAQACDYIRQAAVGLQHAHERGMVHRDIKPHNLLVTRTGPQGTGLGVVKILDMGVARMADNEDSVGTLTQEGSVLGTLDYLSPEQAMNAHTADIRSDLYSLGCTFYYLLTGQPPHAGGTATEKLLRHRLEEPMPVEQRRPDVPAGVAAVVRKLLTKQPEHRFQTPGELAAALAGGPNQIKAASSIKVPHAVSTIPLRSAAEDARTQVDHTEVPLTSPGMMRRPARRKFLWLGGGLVLVFGACLVGVLLPRRPGAQASQAETAQRPATTTDLRYVKQATRDESIVATLQANGWPALVGTWYGIGYFDAQAKGVHLALPLDKTTDLSKAYTGKGGDPVRWQARPLTMGRFVALSELMPGDDRRSICYLYHEFAVREPIDLPMHLGTEAGSIAWHNEELVHQQPTAQTFSPDKINRITLRCKTGPNKLLIKLWSSIAKSRVFICPQWPSRLEEQFGGQLKRDFPG